MTKREIKGIGAIKGFAALVIAQFHMYFLNLPEGMTLPFSKKLQLGYAYGWFMVELFFLLSGFLMFYSHARRIACKERGGQNFCMIASQDYIQPTLPLYLIVQAW